MRHRSSKLDMTHTLTAYLRLCYFNMALFADSALVVDLLVLTAVTLPVLCRTEDSLAEQTVLFGLECTVVDGFGFCDLTV